MDAHNANHVFFLAGHGSFSKIRIVFFQPFNIPYKMEQALVAGRLISRCLFHQHIQIAPADLPCGHGRYIIIISAAPVYIIQQFVDRAISGLCAQLL